MITLLTILVIGVVLYNVMVRMAEKAKEKESKNESQKTSFPQPPEPMPTYGCPMPPEEEERLKAKVESQETRVERLQVRELIADLFH